MEKILFSWYDYILFSLMLGISALIGVYFGCFGNKQSTASEYLMGSKKMKVLPIAVSLVASHVSGITLLAVPADVYKYGASYSLMTISLVIMGLLTMFVYVPVFYNLQITSTYEYLERRFDTKTRLFASFLFTLSMLLYLPIVIYIPALALSAATGINVHFITPVVCGVCIFYTTIGGLKAVVWTDTLQFTVTLGALAAVFGLGINSVGGFENIWTKAKDSHRLSIDFSIDPTIRDTFWSIVLGLSSVWTYLTAVNQGCVQKFLSLSTLKDARLSVVYYMVGLAIVGNTSVFTGLIMYAKYSDCDPFTIGKVAKQDQLLPYYVLDVAGHIPGLPGLFIAGIFCAALSTLSATLNSLAGTLYEDFISKLIKKPSDFKIATILKLTVLVTGIVCTLLVFLIEKFQGILPIALAFMGLTGGPLLALFTVGMLFPKVNSKGAFYGSILGLIVMSWICFTAQYYQSQKIFTYPPKPTSIEGCPKEELKIVLEEQLSNATVPYEIETSTQDIIFNTTSTPINKTEEEKMQPNPIFKISYYYYSFLGCLLSMLFCIIISSCSCHNDPPVSRSLLCPLIYSMLPKEVENSTEIPTVEKNNFS